MILRVEDLSFAPLPHAPFINNAVFPISDHVQLSVSYNAAAGGWYVGDFRRFEAAIQVFDHDAAPNIASLVEFADCAHHNIWRCCEEADLNALVERAQSVKYIGRIEVFDVRLDRLPSVPDWGVRFLCAEGYDFEQKREYVNAIWTAERWRFIPC